MNGINIILKKQDKEPGLEFVEIENDAGASLKFEMTHDEGTEFHRIRITAEALGCLGPKLFEPFTHQSNPDIDALYCADPSTCKKLRAEIERMRT